MGLKQIVTGWTYRHLWSLNWRAALAVAEGRRDESVRVDRATAWLGRRAGGLLGRRPSAYEPCDAARPPTALRVRVACSLHNRYWQEFVKFRRADVRLLRRLSVAMAYLEFRQLRGADRAPTG